MADLLAAPDLTRLAAVLWDYRAAFDRLHFLIETQMLLIANGRDDQLHHMADLMDEATTRLGRLDLEREIVLGAGPGGHVATLSELIGIVESPWDEILRDHQAAIEAAVAKTADLTRRNAVLIRRVQADLPAIATILGAEPAHDANAAATYGRSGRSESRQSGQAYLFENRI
jgi:hypothetical protein